MARQQPTDVHIQFYVLPSASSSDGKGEAAPATAFACAFWPVLRSLWFGGGAAASSSSSADARAPTCAGLREAAAARAQPLFKAAVAEMKSVEVQV